MTSGRYFPYFFLVVLFDRVIVSVVVTTVPSFFVLVSVVDTLFDSTSVIDAPS
jgi:hypothetical protein